MTKLQYDLEERTFQLLMQQGFTEDDLAHFPKIEKGRSKLNVEMKKYASEKLKDDDEIVKTAIGSVGFEVLYYASERLKKKYHLHQPIRYDIDIGTIFVSISILILLVTIIALIFKIAFIINRYILKIKKK